MATYGPRRGPSGECSFGPQKAPGLMAGAETELLCDRKRATPADRGPKESVALFEQGHTLAERAPLHHVPQVPASHGAGVGSVHPSTRWVYPRSPAMWL